MFLLNWIGRLIYGADYDKLSQRVSKPKRRRKR